MKIAFIILAHKNPRQIAQLVNVLSVEEDDFYIHIDKRAEAVFQESQQLLAKASNVFFAGRRYACRWGQFSIVNATLSCLRDLCRRKKRYDYVLLISGQDYPIKTLAEIKRFLQENQGRQFIEAFSMMEPNKWTENGGAFQSGRRVFNWHFFLRGRHFHLPLQRKVPGSLAPYGGSQWWALTGDCVNYVMDYVETHPRIINYFKYTFIPDEIFFQTLICNSPFKKEVTGYGLTYADWQNPNPFPPRVLTVEDFEPLKESNCLFARKFELGRSRELLALVNGMLQQPEAIRGAN
jgi:hypothetical protein